MNNVKKNTFVFQARDTIITEKIKIDIAGK